MEFLTTKKLQNTVNSNENMITNVQTIISKKRFYDVHFHSFKKN